MKNQASLVSAPRVVLDAATAADLMVPNPVSLVEVASVKEAAAFFADKGFSAAPVIDGAGRPVGVLSQSDIVVHDRESGPCVFANPEYYEKARRSPPQISWSDIGNGDLTRVRDIMTPVVFTVAPDTPAYQVIEDMLAHKVHHLYVVGSDGALVGTVSTVDVLRHLHPEGRAEDKRPATAPGSATGSFRDERW